MLSLDSCKNLIKIQQLVQNLCIDNAKEELEKDLFSLKFKILVLIYEEKKVSPSIIVEKLNMAKSNVAMFCKLLIKEDKIVYNVDSKDHRIIYYSLSRFGEKYLLDKLKQFGMLFEKLFNEEENKKFEESLQANIDLLSKKKVNNNA